LLCLFIEIGQIFEPHRHARFLDVAVNSVGFLMGHLSVPALRRLKKGRWLNKEHEPTVQSVRWHWAPLLGWGLCWFGLVLAPAKFVMLDQWDSGYKLFIGNEKTSDRPWAGELRYVAIYDHALNPREVEENFRRRLGFEQRGANRLNACLLTAYDFSQANQYEITPQGRITASDLRIEIPRPSLWTVDTPAALVLGGELLATFGSAGILSSAIAASSAFSIEVWFRPANLSQNGPARIVGISNGILERNFTLGQERDALVFRVRNRLNGPNGSEYQLEAPGALSTELVHVIATYDRGLSSLFRNGRRFGSVVDLSQPSYLLGLGGTKPLSHLAAALLAAMSLLVIGSLVWDGHLQVAVLVRMLLAGYSFLLAPIALSALLPITVPLGWQIWFGPAMILSWAFVSFTGSRSGR
jgi:hypothetical protein